MKRSVIYVCAMLLIPILYFSKHAIAQTQPISEYIVVTSTSVSVLSTNVERKLGQGFKLAGGISYGDGKYLQAIYK